MISYDKFYEIEECGVCKSTEYTTHLKDDIFTVNRCNQCTTHWVTPRLKTEDLKEIYQTMYWNSDSPKDLGYDDYLKQRKLYKRTFTRRLKTLSSSLSKFSNTDKRVLDIGCSNGVFLSLMQEKGWSGVGIDISDYIIDQAKKSIKSDLIEFRSGYLNETVAQNEKFDLITLWDVIEHVEDPIEMLKQVNIRLKPGGYIVIETQNIKSLFAKALKSSWHHFKHYEHIYHFNKAALNYMLNEAGFKIQRITTDNAGKYIDMGFLIERSQRVLPKTVHDIVKSSMTFLKDKTLYANVHDEYIVVAERI